MLASLPQGAHSRKHQPIGDACMADDGGFDRDTGSAGGRARAEKLTPEERSAIAAEAATISGLTAGHQNQACHRC